VQPGIEIDYATGDSWIAGDSYVKEKQNESSSVEESQTNLNEQELREFILNKNTKKFHLPTCSSIIFF
jgi:DNA-entry nuclease